MLYFKSHDQKIKSLVPFTAPVIIDITGQDSSYYGHLNVNGVCVYFHAINGKQEFSMRNYNRMRNLLETLVEYINQAVEDMIEEGEVNKVIDIADWEEGIL